MTRFDPSLIVDRMRVSRGGQPVYDEMFHEGVNIVRGDNSSGKSTILNLLFYGLGGDLDAWSEHAQRCERVTLGVRLNGRPVTLSRAIEERRGQPMLIFAGDFDAAERAGPSQWHRHPYARSGATQSFSQTMFRLLGMPEVAAAEDAGHVTMHQVLRLLYADQLSPVESLFRFERFDPPNLRDVIGRLLLGAFEPTLYANQLALRELERQLDGVSAKLSNLFQLLQNEKHDLSSAWVEAERQKLNARRIEVEQAIGEAERKLYSAGAEDQITLEAQERAFNELMALQTEVTAKREKLSGVLFDIADSNAFIAELERKALALEDAEAMVEPVGNILFQWCPSCYAPLGESSRHACNLCKIEFDSDEGRSRMARLISETALQLNESRLLQSRRRDQAAHLEFEVNRLTSSWQAAERSYQSLRRLPSSEQRDELRKLQREAGYIDGQIEGLQRKSEQVSLIEDLSAQKEQLVGKIERLNVENERLKAIQSERWNRAYNSIAAEVRDLLRHDLRRQDAFENPESIEFDFAANRISVDNRSYFSASSRVILKSSFYLALLAAATKLDFMRHPRFCMIDTIEDKGMEVERSHNFQRQIVRVSGEAKHQHQIIYATAMIAPELNTPEFVVGKASTRDNPTLDLVG